MNYVLNEQNKKLGIFTDIHTGVEKDSPLRLKETQKCNDWVIQTFKQQGVDYVIFMGDLFHSRYQINTNTLNYGIKLIEELSYNFEKLFLILGNHDIYYKNVNTVNSVSFLQKLSPNDNIIVIEDDPVFFKIYDQSFGLFPWGFDLMNANSLIKDFKKLNYVFGHFECNGIELAGSVSDGSKYNLTDLFTLSDYVFSGHYHINKQYKRKNSTLNMIGSSLQLDWGDYNKEKYIYTLDPITNKIEQFKNTVNARFEKVFYSILLKNKYSAEQLSQLCKNNFIKFVIDDKYKFEKILSFTEILKSYNPLNIELDYIISISDGVISESAEKTIANKAKDNLTYLLEYIEEIGKETNKIDESISIQLLKELTQKYYKQSKLSDAEKEEKEYNGD